MDINQTSYMTSDENNMFYINAFNQWVADKKIPPLANQHSLWLYNGKKYTSTEIYQVFMEEMGNNLKLPG